MVETQWLNQLKQLRAEVADAATLDDETRQALLTLAEDLRQLVEDRGSHPTDEHHATSLRDRVGAAVLKFETQHPRLTALLSQIGDGLANLGI